MPTTIPFGIWQPDQPALDNTALVARNVLPGERSYRPFPQLTTASTSLSARAQGAIAARDNSGNPYNYVGESANIRQLVGNSWSAVTSLSGSYTTADSDFWEFAQWGQTVIGVNGFTDQPQQISLGAANFAGLAGTPPKARHICVNRDFVVLGNIVDSATSVNRVRWCAINNPTSWTADVATLADYQDLPTEGGAIQRVVGGIDYGLVFQERAIYRQTFVGAPLAFRFDPIQTNNGLYTPQALCQFQNLVFFLSDDGFYKFDGSQILPIGIGRVDRYFFSQLDPNYVDRIVAAADPVNKIAVWAYPAIGSMGYLTRLLIYSWAYNKWAEVRDIAIEYLWRAMTTGITLDGLDAYFSSIDAVTPDLDNRFWRGGTLQLAGISGRRLSYFNGPPMPATIETGEFQPFRQLGGIAHTTWARPYVEGSTLSMSVQAAVRNNLTESASWLAAVAPLSSGDCPVRATGRFQRARLSIAGSADWTHATGIDITTTYGGTR